MNRSGRWSRCLLAVAASLACASGLRAGDKPLKVKVVVVTMFEVGADTGDVPGEFQLWFEREKLTSRYPLPAAYHDAMVNEAEGVVGIVTGVGTAHSASTVMALGLDARFDFSEAYWLIDGIAGADPADASLGSAAWAEWVVDGDLAHEIDAREMPKDWEDPFVPLQSWTPYPQPRTPGMEGSSVVYHLNAKLCDWAYGLTKDTPLLDNDAMKTSRARYTGMPAAQRPPFVLKGDTLSSGTFWHGRLMDRWANHWVKYWTDGAGNFVTTAMEDTGTMQSLTLLAKAGKVDLGRVMVLRTVSNYDQPPPGVTAAENLEQENKGLYSAFIPSVEAAYRVGSTVVHELVTHWDQYEKTTPGGK